MAPPPRRPLPHLMPELIVDEILVRSPPDDPAFLMRASVVCKPWRRLLYDPAFRRRYVAFHRAPPLLGFLHNCRINDHGKHYVAPRFVCTTTPSPVLPMQPFDDCNYGWRVLDCRHGRVLFKSPDLVRRARILFNAHKASERTYLAVWDSTTGKHKEVPEPPSQGLINEIMAVLCAVCGCDNLDCHDGPYLVVYVGGNPRERVVESHVYSSEASFWSLSSVEGLAADYITVGRPCVVIGNDIYFLLASRRPVVAMRILNINLDNNHLTIINPPEVFDFQWNAFLMATEDGSLGYAVILGSTLSLWSRDAMNSEVHGGWAKCRVIELQTLIPFKNRLHVVGSAEGSGIIFVSTDVGVFSVDLKSGREKKVDEPRNDGTIFPFMSFYTLDGSSSKLRLPMGHPNHTVE